MRIKSIFLLLALSACSAAENDADDPALSNSAHEIFLVRHAEKQTGNDPSLTAAGKRRAETLARLMSDKKLTHIHSTNYRRTLETAAPVASQTGIEVQVYDPSNLELFADELRATPGVHLVVGHSNTTPQLVMALGGDPGSEIDEGSEYDRLYLINLKSDVPLSTLERFGVRYQNDALEKSD